jgi:hypothetical protein
MQVVRSPIAKRLDRRRNGRTTGVAQVGHVCFMRADRLL